MKHLISKLTILVMIACSMLVHSCKWPTTEQKRYVRYEMHSPEAKPHIEAMEKAMRIMRAKNCTDPLSWYYQGAIHWIPDTIMPNSLCDAYHTPADLKESWDNCTHTPSGQEKIHFLVWHRLYIYHFEKIVRTLSGYEDFALPYWGYTNWEPSQKRLQSNFRDPNSSLYEACRYSGLNNGEPISGEIERALFLGKLYECTDYKSFNLQINAAPHGAMHDYIGAGNDTSGTLQFNNPITGKVSNTGLMGWVPTAGFDPIFWMHHSNIDRIWQQWTNSRNGKMVTLEELKSAPWPYVFFDENGKKVEYTPEEIMKILYTMDYDFDDVRVEPKEGSIFTQSVEPRKVAQISPGIEVNSQITDAITVLLPAQATTKPVDKAKIEIEVSFTKVPRGVYEVYVNPTHSFSPSEESFAGYMTFFGADHKMPGESCEKGCCRPLKNGRPTFTFEYTIPASTKYSVHIYKHNGKHTGDLRIETITIKH